MNSKKALISPPFIIILCIIVLLQLSDGLSLRSDTLFGDAENQFFSHPQTDCRHCDSDVNYLHSDSTGPIDSTVIIREAFNAAVETMLDDKRTLSYGIDTLVSPCADHFQFVNGGWRKEIVISKSSADNHQMMTFFDYAEIKLMKRMQELLDSARTVHSSASDPTTKVLGTFYESCMRVDTLEYVAMKKARLAKNKIDSTRSQECLSRTMQHLGGAAGQAFVDDLKRSGAVNRMTEMLAAIKIAAIDRLKENTLMSAEEKTNALERLDRLLLRVGIPDVPVDYSELKLTATDYWGNKVAIAGYRHSRSVGSIGGNLREQWKMSLLRANASYWPADHAIEVPPIMFYPPFFFKDGEDLLNFAGVGYIIGHEIFHSIAPQLPMIKNSIMKAEIDSFKAFNTAIGELDNWRADGSRTFSEDVADLGGSRIAYRAWKQTIKKDKKYRDEIIDGFTPDQRFFIAMGRVWRSKWTPQGVTIGVHAPNFARVNSVAMQNPEFRTAFGCKSGDRMYLSDEKISKIW